MATTAWATVDGFYDDGDGGRRSARAILSHEGFAILAEEGETIARWALVDLVRTLAPDGFMIGARRQTGLFVFDPEAGRDMIRVLAGVPEGEAPMMPRSLVWTMVSIVAVALSALFALGWGFFWVLGTLLAPGSGAGTPG